MDTHTKHINKRNHKHIYLGWENWIEANELKDDPYEAYVTAMYWSTMTVTTVGYGTFSTLNPFEQWMTTGIMIFGAIVHGAIFGSISLYIANFSKQDTNYQESFDNLHTHLIDLGLPKGN